MFINPDAISRAPICRGIKKLAKVPERPAVKTQKTSIVPCMVTRAKYLSGFKAPSSLIHPPGNKLYKTEYSPGFAS